MKAAVEELPEQAGIELSNWYWKVVRQFVSERFVVVQRKCPPKCSGKMSVGMVLSY